MKRRRLVEKGRRSSNRLKEEMRSAKVTKIVVKKEKKIIQLQEKVMQCN